MAAAIQTGTGSTTSLGKVAQATSEMTEVADKIVKALTASRERRQWGSSSDDLVQARVHVLIGEFVDYATTGKKPAERTITSHVAELTPISDELRNVIGQYARLSGYSIVWNGDQIEQLNGLK